MDTYILFTFSEVFRLQPDLMNKQRHGDILISVLHHHVSAHRNKPVPLATFIRENPDASSEKSSFTSFALGDNKPC